MFQANIYFEALPDSYLFSEVARRINIFRAENPDRDIVRMDIGDVSLPLPQVVVNAIHSAADDMGEASSFHGYGPEKGYEFLRKAISENDYEKRGISVISPEDIFISDGAKSDLGNLGDIFGENVRIAVAEPGYPVYVDANVLAGRGGKLDNGRWSGFTYLECAPENDFLPQLPNDRADVIYLCYPNNPTGAAMSKNDLKKWIDYALDNNSLIIFDSAYEAYVSHPDIVRSVYEVEGAEKVAIEIRSFSKTAGFTGVRCGYTVVPRSLQFCFSDGKPADINKMWNRRQSTKFNGVGYIVQKAAESLYTPQGQNAIRQNVSYYMRNAGLLRDALLKKGWQVVGGDNSPYVWFRPFPEEVDSWQFFDTLLRSIAISSTPGIGFGKAGSGWMRFTGFNSYENTLEAIHRLESFSL